MIYVYYIYIYMYTSLCHPKTNHVTLYNSPSKIIQPKALGPQVIPRVKLAKALPAAYKTWSFKFPNEFKCFKFFIPLGITTLVSIPPLYSENSKGDSFSMFFQRLKENFSKTDTVFVEVFVEVQTV